MSHVHDIICSPYINKTLTNQLVQHSRIEGTGVLTFALKQRETHENYVHIVLPIDIQNLLKKYLPNFSNAINLTILVKNFQH